MYYRSEPELKCYDYKLYASVAAIDANPVYCIAPNRFGSRCGWSIDNNDLRKAKLLRAEIESVLDGPERNNILGDFILLQCCTKQHRWRLEKALDCLWAMIERYGKEIIVTVPPIVKAEETPYISPRNVLPAPPVTPTHESKKEEVIKPDPVQQQPRYNLRSNPQGNTSRYQPQPSPTPDVETFEPYAGDPKDNIRDVLLSHVPSRWAKGGEVYGFTRPASPGYVKIGFSGISAEVRVDAWRRCNPGAEMQLVRKIGYPERMERLIHLQMANHRYRIFRCKTCNSMHYEWFKVSIEYAGQILDEWAQVVARETLYDRDGHLTKEWCTRVHAYRGTITAKGLLEVLDAEEQQHQLQRERQLRSQSLSTAQPLPNSSIPRNAFTPPSTLSSGESQQRYPTEFVRVVSQIPQTPPRQQLSNSTTIYTKRVQPQSFALPVRNIVQQLPPTPPQDNPSYGHGVSSSARSIREQLPTTPPQNRSVNVRPIQQQLPPTPPSDRHSSPLSQPIKPTQQQTAPTPPGHRISPPINSTQEQSLNSSSGTNSAPPPKNVTPHPPRSSTKLPPQQTTDSFHTIQTSSPSPPTRASLRYTESLSAQSTQLPSPAPSSPSVTVKTTSPPQNPSAQPTQKLSPPTQSTRPPVPAIAYIAALSSATMVLKSDATVPPVPGIVPLVASIVGVQEDILSFFQDFMDMLESTASLDLVVEEDEGGLTLQTSVGVAA